MAKKLFLVVLSLIFGLSLLFSSCILQNNNIANIASNGAEKGITVSMNTIWINLKPTQSAIAGEIYDVDLYDKGTFRATTTVSFTQPDINVGAFEPIAFPATNDEVNAYFGKDLSDIFSVKVHEPNTLTESSNQQASITLTYPKGGEIWHIGETVTIKWKSSNLPKNTELNIFVVINGGLAKIITETDTVLNTGSYKWTIPQSISGISIIGTNDTIDINSVNVSDIDYSVNFASDSFTIKN